MTTATLPKDKTPIFESDAWMPRDAHEAPARQVTVTITEEIVDQARWSRFYDPVSLAIEPLLNEHSCVETFWNSDSWAPRGAYDDARIGIHVEIDGHDPLSHWLPLSRKATQAMWKLRSKGLEHFTPVAMRLTLPVSALRD